MAKTTDPLETALDAYCDLMVRTLTNLVYLDPEQTRRPRMAHDLYRNIVNETPGARLRRERRRAQGRDWPVFAHSMAGYYRLTNLSRCVRQVIKDDVPGDFIETGVWRGGASILMRGVSNLAGGADRKVYLADSFEGLPPPDLENFPQDEGDKLYLFKEQLGISEEKVRKNFETYNLLDDNVVFVKGWFKDTLPTLEADQFAIVRLDGDMYESTIQAIEALYPKLSPGGYLIVDDYGAIAQCRQAIGEYREKHGITEPLTKIDWTGMYWRKAFD
ncbi:MAG: TylF/MycF/NovP-related O-methyltransferase [Pseudomonadota bacterium]